jgi:hypothetical protein
VFKQLRNNNSGLVFVVVLMVIIVMCVLTLSVVSINISRTDMAEKEVQRVQSSLFGTGALTLFYSRQQWGIPGNMTLNATLGSITYRSVSNAFPPEIVSSMGITANPLNVTVSY